MFLKKFSDFIIKYKKIILIVFAVLLAFAIAGTVLLIHNENKINSDMISYLPKNFDSAKGLTFIKQNFGIRGDAMFVVRGSENDAELKKAVDNIKLKYKDDISQFIWVEDVSKLEEAQRQLDNIDLEKIGFLKDEKITNLLRDEAFTALVPSLKYFADLPSALDMSINTAELFSFLKRDIGDGYYDYVMVIMMDYASSTEAAYKFLDNVKNEFSSAPIIINGKEEQRIFASAGSAQTAQTITEETMGDLPNFLIYAIIAVIIILLLTTSSIIEPLILIVTLGISIVISMGINFLYPNISIISFATCSILQLAITMDYAIFYMHIYKTKRKFYAAAEATKNTIPEVAPSILASGLTTIGGFIALYFMRFKIGTDIANVIIKGIILSIASVLFLQPVLTLLLDKAILKTTHDFTGALNKKIKAKKTDYKGIDKESIIRPLAKFSVWQRIVLIIITVLLIVPAFIGQSKLSYSYMRIYENKMESQEDIFASELGNQTIMAVPLKTKEGYTQQDFIQMVKNEQNNKVSGIIGAYTSISNINTEAMIAMLEIATSKNGISGIQSLIEGLADKDSDTYKMIDSYMKSNMEMSLNELDLDQYELDKIDIESMLKDFDPSMISSYFAKVNDTWYTLYTISIRGSAEDKEAAHCYEYIAEARNTVFGKNTYSIGMLTGSYDLMKTTPGDFLKVTLISIAIILIIVSVLLRNPLKSLIMVLIIELGICINFSIVYLMGQQINFMIYIIISSVQLGCTVDYAILLAQTFENNRDKYSTSKECAINSAIESIPAIFMSAIIIITVCLAVYFVSRNIIIKQLTGMLARGALISFLLVTFAQTAIMSFYKNQKKKVDYEDKLKKIEDAIDVQKKPVK